MIGEINQSKRIELEVKRLGIFELRALAREVGVQSPTTKKREELIVNILERINNGQLDDVVVTKKGRPYKKLAMIDNILNNMTLQDNFASQSKSLTYEDILSFAQIIPVISKIENEYGKFNGVVRKNSNNDFYMFYDLSSAQAVFLPAELKNINKVQNGDEIECNAKKINNNQFFATEIIKINGKNADNYLANKISLGEQIISTQTLKYSDKEVFIGRRNLVILKENFYENTNFDFLANDAVNKGYKIVYLSLNSSIEDEIKFKSLQGKILCSKFDDPSSQSLNKAIDCISLCENLLSRGEKVLLIIPDIINVVRALDYCFMSESKMYGHALQSIIIAQKLLSLGKAYQTGPNITLMLGCAEIDKDDEFVTNQLFKICKII